LRLRRGFQKGDIVNHIDYVVEAAEALDAPGEIWLFRHKILFDSASREWRLTSPGSTELKIVGETRHWILRICGWLQFKYPEGPVYST
jgi:hypothetical protein